jgi:phosphatidylglycerol:prolipoprotein diacylglycerol transferase
MRPHVVHWLEQFVRPDVASLFAPTWFTCVGLAGLVTLVLMLVRARRHGVDPGAIASVVLWCYVAAVGAGIVVPALIESVEHFVTTGRLHLRWSGMTSFWGYLGGAVAVALVCKREGLSLARIGDLAVIPLGVALVFARTGCFIAGCDYGKLSSVPWAVRFPAGSPAWRDHVRSGLIQPDTASSLPVHPTELYEALLGLAIVALALTLARRRRKDGDLFVVVAAAYAIGRIVIETLRGDAGRGIYAGLSSGQIFSLLVLLAIAARFVVVKRRVLAAAAAATLALTVGHVAEAQAQEAPPRDPTERPLYSTGVMLGVATPLNRPTGQVASLDGASLSIGYLPGRFGFWLDLDMLSNAEASHVTLLTAVSYARRPIRRLMLGVRSGIGRTLVDFRDSAFGAVGGMTYRLDAIVEYAVQRHWALWVRPLTIDVIHASELGGSITTYQARIGIAYRFGSRRNAVRPPVAAPAAAPAVASGAVQ